MRRFLRTVPFLRTPALRAAVPEYRPEIAQEKLKNWMVKLQSLSTQPQSRSYLSQLTGLLAYYNRTSQDSTKDIDWKAWQSRIQTKDFVGTVKNNYEDLNKEQYNLDHLFNQIFSKDSKVLDDINNEMTFHTNIWLDNYFEYVDYLLDLDSVSNMNDYGLYEFLDLHRSMLPEGDALIETHNYIPGAKDDVNYHGYMHAQFAWGKRIVTFFRHPTDDNKSGKATKNAMGR